MPETNANTNVDNNIVPPVNTTPVPPVINYEDLIAKARNDEKEKLYPQIEKLKSENEKLIQRVNELLLSNATQTETEKLTAKEISELKAKVEELNAEGEKNVMKDKTVQDLQLEIQKLQDQLTLSANEVTKVRTEYELKEYRSTKLKDVDESVHELVFGASKEDIDASAEKAKATYEKIASKFQTTPPPANQVQTSSFNRVPPVNMSTVNDQFKQVSEADIANMSMADYAVWRKQQGLK